MSGLAGEHCNSKGLGESFPLMKLNTGLSRKIIVTRNIIFAPARLSMNSAKQVFYFYGELKI